MPLLLLGLLIAATQSSAYEVVTHKQLSEEAARRSVLGVDQEALKRLGLRLPIDSTKSEQMFFDSSGGRGSVLSLIRNGSEYEDNIPPGPIYHFFDPRTNLPLHLDPSDYPGQAAAVSVINAITRTSPDWVVLGQGFQEANAFSLPMAREDMFRALTSPDRLIRQVRFGQLFEAIGRMIHHIEDMAQPQHVRNDNHLSHSIADLVCKRPSGLYVPCETYRVLRRDSAYERWTNKQEVLANLPMTGYAPVYPGSGAPADGLTTFSTARQFWANSGTGMAEYTNRNFFSAGTMNETPPITNAPFDIDARTLCEEATPSCGILPPADTYVTFFPTFVDDKFRPDNGATLHPYAASMSIFDPEFNRSTGKRLFTVNRFTFAKDHEFLIPRAVGYSAGLINYFFRGQMQISLPDRGVYSIVDHSPSGCGNPCAFRTLKLKLKNVTPGSGPANEEQMGYAAGDSFLWAVVKYHLNTCYRSDLSGEDGGANFNRIDCRSSIEYVSTSAQQKVRILSATEPQELTFDFASNPIPINASDVFLQVVFRGRLGMEDDAVAVATADISEPTYYGMENVTDYAYDEAGDQKYHPTSVNGQVDVTDVRIAFGPNADKAEPVASLPLLAGGQHAQIAVLMDTGPQLASISLSGQFAQPPAVVQFDPAVFTKDDDGPAAGLYQRNCDLVLRRGLYRERGVVFAQRLHGVGGFHPLGDQTSETTPSLASATTERLNVHAETVRDPLCTHLTTGMYDLSSMTPFTPETAQRWTIRF